MKRRTIVEAMSNFLRLASLPILKMNQPTKSPTTMPSSPGIGIALACGCNQKATITQGIQYSCYVKQDASYTHFSITKYTQSSFSYVSCAVMEPKCALIPMFIMCGPVQYVPQLRWNKVVSQYDM